MCIGLAAAAGSAQAQAPPLACRTQLLDSVGAGSAGADALPRAAIVAQACKPWPYDPGVTLAAVAYARGEAASGERDIELRVAMLSSADAQVLATYSRALVEDAGLELDAHALRLDTARYDLAPGVRAVGVVLHNQARGPSCPDFAYNDELTLLVRDGRQLRPVLQQSLQAWQRVAGEPCGPADKPVVTDQASVTVALGRQRHAGFVDLVLDARIARERFPGGTHTPNPLIRRERQSLRYDGHQYRPVAGAQVPFWAFRP
ncbi:hypothetical protein JR065_20315 [Xanthomonas sp. AmX2]|uniref:hypothetical protein n=1 Tax=Xanthomonas sp. TaxID=29446 RepID=UPI00197D2FCC|nr:hypothetical protein [Xanthomonas sp.]